MLALLFLSAAWHVWIGKSAFPFGGGEAHWVMTHIRPLGFGDGLFVGGLYAAAGVSFLLLLSIVRAWKAVLVGLSVAAMAIGLAEFSSVGIGTSPDGSLSGKLEGLGFQAAPLIVVALISVYARRPSSPMRIAIIAWWPGFIHLLGYLRAQWLPDRFRDGVGFTLAVACLPALVALFGTGSAYRLLYGSGQGVGAVRRG